MERNFKDDITIDRDMLEEECETHPTKYAHWIEMYVHAVALRDQLKRECEQVRAKLSLEVRRDKKLLGGDVKVTNDSVSEYVLTHKEYIDIESKYLEAKKDTLLLGGVKDAFEHRRQNLQDLVKLWLNGYYSNVDVPQPVQDKMNDRSGEKHREILNRTKGAKNG